jgi:hypothetical protein
VRVGKKSKERNEGQKKSEKEVQRKGENQEIKKTTAS